MSVFVFSPKLGLIMTRYHEKRRFLGVIVLEIIPLRNMVRPFWFGVNVFGECLHNILAFGGPGSDHFWRNYKPSDIKNLILVRSAELTRRQQLAADLFLDICGGWKFARGPKNELFSFCIAFLLFFNDISLEKHITTCDLSFLEHSCHSA